MSWRHHWLADPVILLLVAMGVLLGSYQGETSHEQDIDERLYRSTLVHMQDGDSYYEATAKAVVEKSGVGPSQVRSLRTPVLAPLLEPFPPEPWRWLAMVPAVALCLSAAALAGPDLLARRIAAGHRGPVDGGLPPVAVPPPGAVGRGAARARRMAAPRRPRWPGRAALPARDRRAASSSASR